MPKEQPEPVDDPSEIEARIAAMREAKMEKWTLWRTCRSLSPEQCEQLVLPGDRQ